MTRQALPARLPVFPLPNVVLFPDVLLPLHAFEPRYRAMTRDTVDGDRVIGMLLLRDGVDAMRLDAPAFDVGCAGRITESRHLPDGRWAFLLRGERRFRVRSLELTDAGYRVADIEPLEDPTFDELAPDARAALALERARLERAVAEHARRESPRAHEELVERMRALDPLQLVHAIAFGGDYEPIEKQGLLEAADPLERARLLVRILDFRDAARGLPDSPRNVN
jgi:Lon protease-like protein